MTNPNQFSDVLLFVCSKMADGTNLSSKLLLQIEQERSEEESSVGDALALAFRCARLVWTTSVLCWQKLYSRCIQRYWSGSSFTLMQYSNTMVAVTKQ